MKFKNRLSVSLLLVNSTARSKSLFNQAKQKGIHFGAVQ